MYFDDSSDEEMGREIQPRIYRQRNRLDNYSDQSIVAHFRLPRGAIIHLANLISPKIERSYEGRSTDIDPLFQLQIALFHFATGDHQKTIARACGVSQPTVSRIITAVTDALFEMAPNFVRLPAPQELREIKLGFYNKSRMPRIIGCIDGTFLPLNRPPNELDYAYVCHKGFTAINAMGICDSSRKLIGFWAHFPGSCHDSYVLRSSKFYRFMESTPFDGIFLGDSAYPQKKWLYPPVRKEKSPADERYNVAHRTTRVLIEQTFGLLKGRWRCLMNKCRMRPEKLCKIAHVCALLHNVAMDCRAPPPPDDDIDLELEGDPPPGGNEEVEVEIVDANFRDYVIRNF